VKATLRTSGEDVKTTLETSGEDVKNTLETSGEDAKNTLEASGEDAETTLETSGEDVRTTLKTSGEDQDDELLKYMGTLEQHKSEKLNNELDNYFKDEKAIFSTRFECIFTSLPLVSGVFSQLLHSFRVCFHNFSTRFECNFRSFHQRSHPRRLNSHWHTVYSLSKMY
jgi:rubrerythrin